MGILFNEFNFFKLRISLTVPSFSGTVKMSEINSPGSWVQGTITPLSLRANISSLTRLLQFWSHDMEFCGYSTWSNGWEMNSIHSPEVVWCIVASVAKAAYS